MIIMMIRIRESERGDDKDDDDHDARDDNIYRSCSC